MALALGIDGLGPLDDHQFIRTIFLGEQFNAYVLPDLGRFIPLTAQEYVLAAKLGAASPVLFHIIGGIKILLCGSLLLHCLMLTRAKSWAVVALWSATIFSIGFANAGFRLQVGEMNTLLLLLCFVWSVLINNANDGPRIKNQTALVGGLLAIVLTFFYKEVSFILAITFAVSELYRHYRQNPAHIPKRALTLLVVGVIYIVAYLAWRTSNKHGSYASYHTTPVIEVIQLFATNDPFIFFIVLPLTLLRLIAVLRNAQRQTVFDSLLAGSSAYALAYIALGIFNTYYLLPAYAFAACGIAGLTANQKLNFKKAVILFVTIFSTVNNLPTAVSDMYALKSIANNHWKFVHSIAEWMFENPLRDGTPRNLVLAGVSPGSDIEVISSLQTYLESLGVPASNFRIKLTLRSNNKIISESYGVEDDRPYQAMEGDLVIFNPYQSVFSAPPLLTPSYRQIYRSESDWDLPRWSAVEWITICLVDEYDCKSENAANRRYTGYAAMLVSRSGNVAAYQPVPLLDPSFRVGPLLMPTRMRAGTSVKRDVLVMNDGTEIWPANGKPDGKMVVNLAYVWLDEDGKVAAEGNRYSFRENLQPGDLAKISIAITAPAQPGKYQLVITPVQEGVRWFYRDSKSLVSTDIDVFDADESILAHY